MPRETAVVKAERLLLAGRVVLIEVHGRYVRAIVRGDTEGFHVVEHDRGVWSCDCSSYRICSHRRAVMLVYRSGRRPRRP
jgi:uncharacterized Zn finger protein